MFDWAYIIKILPTYEQALWLTVKISFFGILLAGLIGALSSMIVFYKVKILASVVQAYITFFRNTPLLLHLFFLYYGLPRISGIVLDFEHTALIGLSLLGGSYMAEAFRSGMESVAKSQLEAGEAIGLNRLQMMRYVILPQAISYSVPALGANCVFLFKETSVFTAIAGTDITTVAIGLINMDYKTNESLLLLVSAYLIVLLPFVLLLTYVEKRVRHAEFGH